MSNSPDSFEQDLQALLSPDQPQRSPAQPTPPQTEATPEPPPLDRDAERQAYADLIAFMKANKDSGTEISFVSVDDFMSSLE